MTTRQDWRSTDQRRETTTVTVRVHRATRRRLERAAANAEMSLNAYTAALIEQALASGGRARRTPTGEGEASSS